MQQRHQATAFLLNIQAAKVSKKILSDYDLLSFFYCPAVSIAHFIGCMHKKGSVKGCNCNLRIIFWNTIASLWWLIGQFFELGLWPFVEYKLLSPIRPSSNLYGCSLEQSETLVLWKNVVDSCMLTLAIACKGQGFFFRPLSYQDTSRPQIPRCTQGPKLWCMAHCLQETWEITMCPNMWQFKPSSVSKQFFKE